MERKRVQSDEAHTQRKRSFNQAEDLMKKRGCELDKRDRKIVEKDQKIADMEKNYSLANYSRGLWANDKILLRFSEVKPFVAWMEPPTNEPMVDIEGDDDEVS